MTNLSEREWTVLTALWDSGNGLRDPSGGRPVLVAAPGSLDSILPERVQKLLTPDLLRFPADLLEPVRQAAPEAAAVPCGRDARGAAADGAHGLDGDRRNPVSGPAGGPVSHGTGKRI